MVFLESIPISLAAAMVAVGLAAVGSAIQGSVGFGLGLVAAPLLLLVDPAFVPGPMLAAALVLTLLVAWRDRRSIDVRGLGFAIVGRVAGTIPAALVVSTLARDAFELVFGILILAAVALSLLGPRIAPSRRTAVAAGAVSGFMATVAAVGGPPMALLYQHQPGRRLRGTLAGFFIFGASLSLLALAAVGRFGAAELRLALILIPGIIVGFVVSGGLARRLDRGGMRYAVLGLSLVAAIVVLARTVAGH